VIRSYQLEPSTNTEHGNWCLSGYQFVGFLWGSAQLAGIYEDGGGDDSGPAPNGELSSPAAVVTDAEVCRRHRDEYVFAKCMDAVYRRAENDVPLWYHSYQLWNLTALLRWDRVNGCLMAAYQRDVLGRYDVVRQLAFCKLFKFGKNVRPPGTSFYDIVPAAPPSETAAVSTTTNVLVRDSYDSDDDDERRTFEYGKMEDGETEDGELENGGTGDVETIENKGLLLYDEY